LLEAIQGFLKPTDIVWMFGINITGRLLHIYLLLDIAVEESVLYIHLPKSPPL
jgi:hypothetical protein